jgi:hypothetical protein
LRCKFCNAGSPRRLRLYFTRCAAAASGWKTRLAEERIIERGGRLQRQEQLPSLFDDDEDTDLDEAGGAELEQAEQEIVDRLFISRLWRLLRFREERR